MNLICFGRRGASSPLLLLYGPLVEGQVIKAPAFTLLSAIAGRSETLREFEPHGEAWRPVRGGLRVSVPRMDAGHRLKEGLTLTHKSRKAKAI